MIAPCNIIFLLSVHCWLIFAELVLPNNLEGLDFLHLQCLTVQIIHVLDGAYLQSESALPA